MTPPGDEAHHHHADPDTVLASACEPVGELRERLDAALAETGVAGVRVDPATGGLDLLLHAPCLDVDGRQDADLRRVLRLIRPHRIDVTLLREPLGADAADAGPSVVCLDGLEALEAFFASLTWASTLCGHGFLSEGGAPVERGDLSLDLDVSPAPYGLRWFVEGERDEDDGPVAYRVEGWVGFERLAVVDADGEAIAVDAFCEARDRWWRTLLNGRGGDPDPAALAWRPWAGQVPAGHHGGAAPREA